MPRRGRGGRGQRGTIGRDYPNRSDLAFNAKAPGPENIPPGQVYGARRQQEEMGRTARAAQQARAVPQPDPVMQAAEAFVPPQLGALDRPSERPNESVTAGLSQGAGPGSEALPAWAQPGGGPAREAGSVLPALRALFVQFPTEELRELIEEAELG